MYAVIDVIKAQLQSCTDLADFQVRASTDNTTKRTTPAIEVAFEGVRVPDTTQNGVKLAVAWGVHLIVSRSDEAATVLDAAFAAVIATLHGYKPGKVGGRVWTRLEIQQGGTVVQEPEFADQGLVEYAVIFETTAVYAGRKQES